MLWDRVETVFAISEALDGSYGIGHRERVKRRLRGTKISAKDSDIAAKVKLPIDDDSLTRNVLWRRSTNFLPKVSRVPLGMARTAIDYMVETVKNRVEIPSGRPLRNSRRIQSRDRRRGMLLGRRSFLRLRGDGM